MKREFWNNKNVLVTGNTGFKGSWLSLWLKTMGAKISGLSLGDMVSEPNLYTVLNLQNQINDYRGDIVCADTCLQTIIKTKPQILFHLAAQPIVRLSYASPLKTYKTNIIGTANILESARACDSIKVIVIITTDKCYEDIEKVDPFVETDQLGGYDPYSSSKACAEHITSAYYRSFFKEKEVGVATVRAGNVIGGGDWAVDRLIPDAVKTWSQDQTLTIRYPNAIRPWQHVLEPLSGYLTIAQNLWNNPRGISGAWNFGPEQNNIKTVRDTVQMAASEWIGNANWEISQGDHLHETKQLKLNSDKAKSILGWKPRMEYAIGVKETIRWYKEYYNNNPDMNTVSVDQIEEYENISNCV